MPRSLRYVPASGTLVEVTARTVHGRLLLQPTPPINKAVLGVLGRAQRVYGMVVHFAVVLSNHYHLLLAPTDAKQLADFMGFVNSNIAREVGRLVDWKEKFWGRRYQGIVVSDEVSAQLSRLEYLLANCVKEYLVENPLDWPGVHSARALIEGCKLEGTWFDRTAYYRAQKRRKAGDPPLQEGDFKTTESLELTPLPCLANLGAVEQRDYIQGLIQKSSPKRLPPAKKKARWCSAPPGSKGNIPIPSRIGSKNRRRPGFTLMRSPFGRPSATRIQPSRQHSGSLRTSCAVAIGEPFFQKGVSRQPWRSVPDRQS